MNMKEACEKLRELSGGAYCGIEKKAALFPSHKDFKTDYRAFIELDACPTCNKNPEYISVYAYTLEDVIVKIGQEIEKHKK